MSKVSWFEDTDWCLVEVSGEDRVDFLHRLTTNVLPSQSSPLVHNFFLSVNAKIQAEFWVSAGESSLYLLTPKMHLEALKECIDRYHFGEKIEVLPQDGKLFVVAGSSPETLHDQGAKLFKPDPRYGQDCVWCYLEPEKCEQFERRLESEGEVMTEVEAERRRVALGRPRAGVDYDDNSLFVEVAQTDDFSETKGCYPGQEIVARVLHRGRLNKHLRAFVSDDTVPSDWQLKVDGKEVATVKSSVSRAEGGSSGYLLVRREYGEEGNTLEGEDENGKSCSLKVIPRPGEVLTGGEE